MPKQKKHRIITISFLLVSLLAILSYFSVYSFKTLKFNNTEHVFTNSQNQEEVEFSIYHRGGQSDSWIKRNVMDIVGVENLPGTIYEGKISNNSPYLLHDWKVRINILQDCYINKGWCGRVEIHQFTGATEKSQLLDLREVKQEQVLLNYVVIDQEVLITLSKGDYIIYHPNTEFELQIQQNTDCFTGLIFYCADENLDLNNFKVQYHLQKKLFEGKEFKITLFALSLWLFVLIAFLSYEVSELNSQKKIKQKDILIEEALKVFSKFVDAKDSYTNGHSSRVAEYAKKIAEKLNFSETAVKDIYYIALLHDCGKCYISDSVLKKPGKLTDEEYESIKLHTKYGAQILENFKSLPNIFSGALYHHERFDGNGYPTGKSGEEIPIIGRIICVADSFDAMNSSRCYREPLPMEKIVQELINGKGTQFDPKVVDAFLEVLKEENNFMS